jgi:hypothetical protein
LVEHRIVVTSHSLLVVGRTLVVDHNLEVVEVHHHRILIPVAGRRVGHMAVGRMVVVDMDFDFPFDIVMVVQYTQLAPQPQPVQYKLLLLIHRLTHQSQQLLLLRQIHHRL